MNLRGISARGLAASALAGAGLASMSAASAQPSVATDSAVFVERITPAGPARRSLEPVDRLSRGDRVVTVVTWHRTDGNGDFTITNPLPRAIAYQASARDDQEVSADGGRSWGRLGELRIGNRLATPEDVTHMRWRIASRQAQSGRGHLVYSGIVR